MFITRDAGATYKNVTSSLGLNCWNTPFELHPADTATVILGSDKVFATHDSGNTWTAISPAFSSPFGCLKAIRIAPGNPNYIYVLPPTGSVLRYTTNFWLNMGFHQLLPSLTGGTDGKVSLATQGEFDTAGRITVNTADVPPGFYICEISNNVVTIRDKVVVY